MRMGGVRSGWEHGMPRTISSYTPLQGLLADTSISFNIRRSENNRSEFPRKVMVLPSSPRRKSVIPGLLKNKERTLFDELRKFQSWKAVVQHSFEMSSRLFSFQWRFRTDPVLGLKEFRALEPVDSRTSKKIEMASRKFKAHLRAFLKPGHVYLIPDAEVTFNRRKRFKQGYARPVLILAVQNEQIVMVPFSTKIERMNRKTDILFDSEYKGERLDPDGLPPVENLPLSVSTQKAALFVCAAQPMTKEAFLEGAIAPVGSVSQALLNIAEKKLKNM